NVKNYAGIPEHSIRVVFRRTGIDPRDVGLVALSSRIRTTVPTLGGRKRIYKVLHFLTWLARTEWATNLGRRLLPMIRKRRDLLRCLPDTGRGGRPILAFDPPLCPPATASSPRPWPAPATVLTLDGAGDGLCASVNVGRGHDLEVLARTPKYHSPADGLYSAITALLGLKPYEHEYKVMGMAPYGQARYCIDVTRQAFSGDGLKFRNHTGRFGPAIRKYFHRRLAFQRFDNVSAACQQAFEEMMVQWVRNAVAATGVRKVTAAGGAFLNVKANKLVREMPEVE